MDRYSGTQARPDRTLPTQSDVKALRELYAQYGEALTNRLLPDGTGKV